MKRSFDILIAVLTIVLQCVAKGVTTGIEGFAVVFTPWVGWTLLLSTGVYLFALFLAVPFYTRQQPELVMGLAAALLLGSFGFLDLFLNADWPGWTFVIYIVLIFVSIIAAAIFLGSRRAFDGARLTIGRLHRSFNILRRQQFYGVLSLPLLTIASAVTLWMIEGIVATQSAGSISGFVTIALLAFALFQYAPRAAVFPQEKVRLVTWAQRFGIVLVGIAIGMLF